MIRAVMVVVFLVIAYFGKKKIDKEAAKE